MRMTKERDIKTELEQEKIRKEKDLKILELQDQRIKERLTAILKYENYLEDVKDESEEFDEIGDIVNRYKTLTDESSNLD